MACKCTNICTEISQTQDIQKYFLIYILKIKYDTVSNVSSENSSRLFL